MGISIGPRMVARGNGVEAAVFAPPFRLLVLDQGRVVEQGTHEQLTAGGGLYARMWADYNRAVQWKITSEG